MDNEDQILNQDGATEKLLVSDVVEQRSPLTIDLPDTEFIERAEDLIDSYKKFAKKINLEDRRKTLKKFRYGREDQDTKFKKNEDDFEDSIIYEAESYIGPMAVSKMPDIIVKPGTDSDESKKTAKELSVVITSDISSRERKRVLKRAFEHLPVGLVGVIKPYWDPAKGKDGDYAFKVVHYDNIVFDTKATTNDARDMDFIGENIEWTVKEWVMHFPKKEEAFYEELHNTGWFTDSFNENTNAGMNSKVKGWEFWFTWYDKKENGEYERIEAVAWYYNKLVLDKMKSPNWDWEGEQQTFSYENEKLGLQDMQSMMEQSLGGDPMNPQPDMTNPGLLDSTQTQKIYHNHMDYPEKPYIFLGYDQWGDSPIDETSRIEQAIKPQKGYNKRNRQITNMINSSRGKNVFSGEAGLKKDDLEDLDMTDWTTDLFVKGKVNEVFSHIPGDQPGAPLISDKNELRERIFDKMGVHGPARGEVDMGSPATNNQISREGDFTRSDDLTDDTINYAAEKMANWELQFIKLRYTKDHFKKTLGPEGQTVWTKLNRDMVEDGMEVSISASGSDKLKAEQKAMDMAKLQLTDPFTFYTDIGASDPKGRTKKLVMFMDPNMRSMYLQEIGIDMAGTMAGALGAQQPGGAPPPQASGQDGATQAAKDIMTIQSGAVPPVPQVVDGGYLATFTQFVNDPQGLEAVIAQHPDMKQLLLSFAEQITQLGQQAAQGGGQPAQGATPTPQPAAQPPASPQGNVGPLTGNPSPDNTSRVAATPGGM